jgi:methionyl-tRNA formyltransferase
MRLVFFGTPDFALPSLTALIEAGYSLVAVVTQPDRQKGRGRRVLPPPVKVEAQRHGLPVLQPLKAREEDFIRDLRRLGPDLIIVVAYGQILPPDIIHMPRMGCINLHASLLPKYRGAAPINWAIINGERKTGVTTMLMDEGMDTGPVLLQKEIEIDKEDTAGTLSKRLASEGAELLITTIEGLKRGEIRPVPQSGETSYAPPLKKADGLIDWSMPATRLHNFIRGVTPWPGAYTFLDTQRLKIIKAVPVDGEGRPGFIERVSKDELLIGTGKGLLSIKEIQIEGRAVMDIRAFLQGHRLEPGMGLGTKRSE